MSPHCLKPSLGQLITRENSRGCPLQAFCFSSPWSPQRKGPQSRVQATVYGRTSNEATEPGLSPKPGPACACVEAPVDGFPPSRRIHSPPSRASLDHPFHRGLSHSAAQTRDTALGLDTLVRLVTPSKLEFTHVGCFGEGRVFSQAGVGGCSPSKCASGKVSQVWHIIDAGNTCTHETILTNSRDLMGTTSRQPGAQVQTSTACVDWNSDIFQEVEEI